MSSSEMDVPISSVATTVSTEMVATKFSAVCRVP